LFKKFLVLLLISSLFAVPVWASEVEEPARVQYSSALRSALRNRPEIVQFENDLEDFQELRRSMQDMLEHLRRAGAPRPEQVLELERQVAELGSAINRMQIARDMTRVGTEAQMRAGIIAVENALLDIQLMEAELAHSRVNFEATELRFNAGLISESDLRSAELGLQQGEANLAALRVSLESDRHELNRILQRPVTDYIYVAFDRELIELPADLNAHVRRTAHRQVNVRMADIAVNAARRALRDFDTAFGTPERAARERELNHAERSRAEALRAVETSLRNHYNTLTMLMHNNESLKIELQRAEERLEVVELNYQAGLATPFEIEAAELAVLRAEVGIERNLNSFWSLQFLFQNPFIGA